MNNIEFRKKTLALFGAEQQEIEELLSYNTNHFEHTEETKKLKFPLPSEPFFEAWKHYAEEAKKGGVLKALQKPIVQFRFPIQEGMGQDDSYIDATRRGASTDSISSATGINLSDPNHIELLLHESAAGPVPALIIGRREDFESILQALTMHNEPKPVPPSMGACMIKGYNNWDRVLKYRKEWESKNTAKNTEEAWPEEFQQLAQHKELYQDRFMLVSSGPYSNVPADVLGLKEDEWKHFSAMIRLHHECVHFFTLRVFGSMNNNLLDEVLADYMGIRGAIGSYKAKWFLYFMGLENYPTYREGGRMQNYLGNPSVSESSFKVLQKLLISVAKNLELFDSKMPKGPGTIIEQASLLMALSSLTLEEMGAEDGVSRCTEAYAKYKVF